MLLQWLVGTSEEHERIAAAGVSALGPNATVHHGPFETAPEARVRLVFASELATYLDALPPAERTRRCERTILVNAERSEVLELLERHGLGGAIECEELDAWTAYDARIFVRKEMFDPRRGERIGGPGRESERYMLWTHRNERTNTCRLADLVRECAAACSSFAARFDEIVVAANEARRHQLPAVGVRMVIGRTGLLARAFPRPGYYLQLSSPPGGLGGVDVLASTHASPLEAARDLFSSRPGVTLEVGELEHIQFASALRQAVACEVHSSQPFPRRAWCVVAVEHRMGTLVVRFAGGLAAGSPVACAAVLSDPVLEIVASSFSLLEP